MCLLRPAYALSTDPWRPVPGKPLALNLSLVLDSAGPCTRRTAPASFLPEAVIQDADPHAPSTT